MTFAMRCLIQSLTVYDGSTPNYVKRLARLCGMVEEIKPIPSTSNSMLIVLETFSPRFQELKGEVYFTYGKRNMFLLQLFFKSRYHHLI